MTTLAARGAATALSVIIVNYNGRHLLGDLFESLARQSRPADEVIMVDNASSDDSVAFVGERFPWVRIIASPTNTGFAEGNNIGLRAASGDYIALLNSDTVVEEHLLAELCAALERDRRVGAAVAKIYLAGTAVVIDCAGAEFNNLGYCWGRGALQPDRGQFEASGEVPAATACAMLLRREVLGGAPLFDPELFMYYEEFDLSLRIRGRGAAIVYVPTAVVHHRRSQAVKGAVRQPLLFQQLYGNRNRVKLLAKYYPLPVLLRSLPLIALSLLYWDLYFLRHGGPRLCLRAVAGQARFAWHGLRERSRTGVAAEGWLPWMKWHGLRDVLALRRAFTAT